VNLPAWLPEIPEEQPYPLVFATISGAHLYGFPSADSDVDLRGVHLLPLREVVGLRTGPATLDRTWTRDGVEVDLPSGGCVIVDGVAGIGKSHLPAAAMALGRSRGLAIGAGRATELDRVAPLSTLLTALTVLPGTLTPARSVSAVGSRGPS
jgi:hypothetical protein